MSGSGKEDKAAAPVIVTATLIAAAIVPITFTLAVFPPLPVFPL